MAAVWMCSQPWLHGSVLHGWGGFFWIDWLVYAHPVVGRPFPLIGTKYSGGSLSSSCFAKCSVPGFLFSHLSLSRITIPLHFFFPLSSLSSSIFLFPSLLLARLFVYHLRFLNFIPINLYKYIRFQQPQLPTAIFPRG